MPRRTRNAARAANTATPYPPEFDHLFAKNLAIALQDPAQSDDSDGLRVQFEATCLKTRAIPHISRLLKMCEALESQTPPHQPTCWFSWEYNHGTRGLELLTETRDQLTEGIESSAFNDTADIELRDEIKGIVSEWIEVRERAKLEFARTAQYYGHYECDHSINAETCIRVGERVSVWKDDDLNGENGKEKTPEKPMTLIEVVKQAVLKQVEKPAEEAEDSQMFKFKFPERLGGGRPEGHTHVVRG